MNAGDKINVNGKIYEAHSFNIAINNKRTDCTTPCLLCDLDSFNDLKICNEINCIEGTEFLYLKLIK